MSASQPCCFCCQKRQRGSWLLKVNIYGVNIHSPSFTDRRNGLSEKQKDTKYNQFSRNFPILIQIKKEMVSMKKMGPICLLHVVKLKVTWFQKLSFKGQLISKCYFGIFNFFQKTNKNKSTWGFIVVKLNSFVHFLEETLNLKKLFQFCLAFLYIPATCKAWS